MTLRFAPDVAPEVRANVRAFAQWVEQRLYLRGRCEVWVGRGRRVRAFRDAPLGRVRSGGHAVGSFLGLPGRAARIRIAGGYAEPGVAVSTLAHELVHWEQWRERRELTERGVEERARSLVRRWRKECPRERSSC